MLNPIDTQASAARAIVMAVERGLGFEPTDREFEKLGYDIESRVPGTGKLRIIEVKGRNAGAETITVTRNEVLYSLNKPDDFILAMVEFLDGGTHRVHYLRQPFRREPAKQLSFSFSRRQSDLLTVQRQKPGKQSRIRETTQPTLKTRLRFVRSTA